MLAFNMDNQYNDEGDDMSEYEDNYEREREDNFRDDVDADANTLASAGYGTDEDYGYYGESESDYE
jgi:hypothetical protein